MIYIADCDKNGGIYACEIEKDKLIKKQYIQLDRPMYLATFKNKLYCILRAPFEDNDNSAIISFDVLEDGTLTSKSDPVSTEGVVSCHLCVKDGAVFNANYRSGSVNKLGVKTVTHNGKSAHPTRQEAAHTHFTRVSPDEKYILVCDLGMDTIFTYDTDLNEVSRASVPAGNGVRHLEYSPDGKTVYSADELTSTISVFDYNDGKLEYVTTVEGHKNGFAMPNTAAAIKRKGNLLYISHRGFDGISVFDISNKIPEFVTCFKSGGTSPRDFGIFGDYIVVTNEGGNACLFDTVNYKLLDEIKLNSPLCVIEGENI